MRKLYFAHPKALYGSKLEDTLIELLKISFPSCDIINPADYQDLVEIEKYKMQYFFSIIDICSDFIYMSMDSLFPNSVLPNLYGSGISAGVARELVHAIVKDLSIHELKTKFDSSFILQSFSIVNRLNANLNFYDIQSIEETRKANSELLELLKESFNN